MPVFNVLDYGVAGDGQQNDAPAIQAVIDACHLAGAGRCSSRPVKHINPV